MVEGSSVKLHVLYMYSCTASLFQHCNVQFTIMSQMYQWNNKKTPTDEILLAAQENLTMHEVASAVEQRQGWARTDEHVCCNASLNCPISSIKRFKSPRVPHVHTSKIFEKMHSHSAII